MEDDLRPEYDFSKMKIVGRGIYAKRYRSGTNLVLLDPDIRKAFPDDESVNEALRVLAKAAKRLASRGRKSSAKKPRLQVPIIMSAQEPSTYRPFVFTTIEDDGVNVTIEVSEEDYQADLAAGIDEEATMKPGRYKMTRGGFLARHPELKLKDKKRA